MKCKPSEDVCLEHSRPLIGERFCEENCKHARNATTTCLVQIFFGEDAGWKRRTTSECLDCDAMLSLGPANDEPEEVVQELTAAIIASKWDEWNDEHHGVVSMGAMPLAEQYLDICIRERDAGRPGRRRDVFDLEIGDLARQIHEHKETP